MLYDRSLSERPVINILKMKSAFPASQCEAMCKAEHLEISRALPNGECLQLNEKNEFVMMRALELWP